MRERLSIVALALFVALDIALIAVAVRHVQAPASGSDRRTASVAVESPSGGSSGSDQPTATESASPALSSSSPGSGAASSTAFLAVADDHTLLRASRGSCDRGDRAVVAVSTDAGASFEATRVPSLAQVLGVRATSGQDLAVIGLNARCQVNRFSTTDGGSTWRRSAGGGGTWSLGADRGTVDSPTGTSTPPCTPQAVSTVNETLVRLLCDNGKVLGTDDNGDTWVTLGTLPGAVDLRFTTAGEGIALATQKGCRAAVMRSVDGGAQWKRVGCVPGAKPAALGSQGQVIAAQVGDQLFVSTDDGASWPAPTTG